MTRDADGPWTASGKALRDASEMYWERLTKRIIRNAILAIEAEAAAPEIDVERLARAMRSVPRWRREYDRWGGGISRQVPNPELVAAIATEYARLGREGGGGVSEHQIAMTDYGVLWEVVCQQQCEWKPETPTDANEWGRQTARAHVDETGHETAVIQHRSKHYRRQYPEPQP